MEDVIVGARGSRLAQAMVQELITHIGACPVVRFRARSVMTSGDRDRKTAGAELASVLRERGANAILDKIRKPAAR